MSSQRGQKGTGEGKKPQVKGVSQRRKWLSKPKAIERSDKTKTSKCLLDLQIRRLLVA